MNALNDFIRDNFVFFFAFAVVWNAGVVGYTLWRRAKRGPKFPKLSQVQIRFREQFASGYSHKSWVTRLGGASNCLVITITADELWITSFFPFNLLLDYYDLEHRMPLHDIVHVEQQKRHVHIDFQVPDNGVRRFTVISRKASELRAALTASAPAEMENSN